MATKPDDAPQPAEADAAAAAPEAVSAAEGQGGAGAEAASAEAPTAAAEPAPEAVSAAEGQGDAAPEGATAMPPSPAPEPAPERPAEHEAGAASADLAAVRTEAETQDLGAFGRTLSAYRPRPFVGLPVRFRDRDGRRFGGEPVTAAIVTQVFDDELVNLWVLPNGHADPFHAAVVAFDEDLGGRDRGWAFAEPSLAPIDD